jgi:hypothetical protein
MLGIALPADHPVWTVDEVALPSEDGGSLRAIRAPGWIAREHPEDGIVRVVNHGTDHTVEGGAVADSTALRPVGLLDRYQPGPRRARLDRAGRPVGDPRPLPMVGSATAAACVPTWCACADGARVAGSTAEAHWVEPDRGAPDSR